MSDGTSEPQMECKLQKSLIKVLLGPPTVLLVSRAGQSVRLRDRKLSGAINLSPQTIPRPENLHRVGKTWLTLI